MGFELQAAEGSRMLSGTGTEGWKEKEVGIGNRWHSLAG